MWKMPESVCSSTRDGARLLEELRRNEDFFDPARPLVVSRAPGRLDLMGGFADYSGGLVLEMPIARAAFAAVQFCEEPALTIRSADIGEDGGAATVSLPYSEFFPDGAPMPPERARAFFAAREQEHWAAYVAGVLLVLARARALRVTRGMRVLIVSDVPLGKGVSSSAALEVAALRAFAGCLDVNLEGRELALLGQQAENLVVGAPCGVMDQMTAAFGRKNHMVVLLCQPAELQGLLALPPEVGVWAVDSGIRHAITGADYGSVRIGTFMGYRIIADLAGLPVAIDSSMARVQDARWNGYLANLTPSEYEGRFRSQIPETMSGRDFLSHYGGTTDAVTRVDPTRLYAVRRPIEHPVYEQHRVRLVRALTQAGTLDSEALSLIGEMMYQAHESYNACNIGSDGTDALVALARAAGPARGVYGAKITGGGSGGMVAILARADAGPVISEIAERYRETYGRGGQVLEGSSDGALAFGTVQLDPA